MGTGVVFDPDYGVWTQNESDVATSDVMRALHHADPEMAAMVRWGTSLQRQSGRRGSLFERDIYALPGSVYDQMRVAYQAVANDDVVAGVVETTESLAFSRMSFYADDLDEQDVWNQVAGDLDLDARLREMWRELFTVSQVIVAMWWGRKSYRVRGRTKDGVRRKREFRDLFVPTSMAILDPLKIVPVGNPVFGGERLAWIADRSEAEGFDRALTSRTGLDPVVERLIVGRYDPSDSERKWLGELGVDTHNLFLLNPTTVFRHTATKPGYMRFANVRLASCFELLDLKQQLKEMDRAHLLGGTNFIVLIRKGTDALPAKPAEVANLQAQVRTVARMPVLVGDHRLHVEIVTPKLDTTLNSERYDTLDDRLKARLFQMFAAAGGRSGTRDDSTKLVKMVARGMESRRHMMRRALEAHFIRPIVAQNPVFTAAPHLRYHPAQISLSFDSDFASFLLEMRASNEISRETILSQFDLDQDDEAAYREREEEVYDDIFKTQVPFSAPNPANARPDAPPEAPSDPRSAGRRQGGNRNGGGAAPGSGQGQKPRRPRRTSD